MNVRLPDIPKCSNNSPWSMSTSRYLPRLRMRSTRCPVKFEGSHPSGQRNGLPRRTSTIVAPAMWEAKPRRVTSTSGNSGIVWGKCEDLRARKLRSTGTLKAKKKKGKAKQAQREMVGFPVGLLWSHDTCTLLSGHRVVALLILCSGPNRGAFVTTGLANHQPGPDPRTRC